MKFPPPRKTIRAGKAGGKRSDRPKVPVQVPDLAAELKRTFGDNYYDKELAEICARLR